ncbi:MAG TPA: methyl-accepting chemotaxis protein, partial [Candidatus Sulfopaludibacter sp.]|nr:methyl-accepting chemotaxis protein [Candidatus Sulfopaludibacter sp.]
ALIAVILAPLGAYLISGRQSHRQLEEVLNRYNRKLDIGTQVELATTEMQGSQRGVMLSYAMNDPGASRQYKDLYATSGTKIDGLMEQLHPLLDNDAEKAAIADIQSNRANWAPRFQKLLETCESGDIDAAYKLRNENKVISAKMHAAATQLAQEQRKALDRVKAASDAAVAASNRIAALVTVLCAAVSAFLLVTVRREVAKLRRAVTDLRQTAGEVATASGQVASSSQAVAQGASEQAASIEETSSSTEQINAMTRRNAEQLGEAAELATRTGSAIEDANRALGEMQASMEEINGACEEVGHIIKVIDEIAFQTNILALNAAVESARAGEAGMGFAVVADEVRNLAQRSAKAASETTGLIEESIAKSRQGRHNLELVSGAIGKLTGSAHQITKLLEQVRNGSAEQSRGVQQISSAMSRIDHVTQGSASAAEETAAVGEEMSAQAATLNEIVQRLHFLVG